MLVSILQVNICFMMPLIIILYVMYTVQCDTDKVLVLGETTASLVVHKPKRLNNKHWCTVLRHMVLYLITVL